MDSPHQIGSRELRDAVASSGTTLSAHLSEGPGTRIGPYKLLQQIGEGGFGVVFMAEQERPVRRRVAMKIIKLGMDTRRVVARFEAERQALAMMDHPNIARVLDAGATDSGRPYFVMELVRGVPITEYCDANNLTAVERLELFIPVCRAIQHAHIKGVIHRDIKPSNILVTLHDGKPVPKVIDFGIAKATDHRLTEKTLFTELKAIIGTPAYMSPEQAEMSGLDIDTRTDVYSLGVLLYELLTGTTPFPAEELLRAGYMEMQRIIREVEPPRPSTRVSSLSLTAPSPRGEGRGEGPPSPKPQAPSLSHIAAKRRTEPKRLGLLLRGDLDWIAMKALEKDRTRRYETAEAFAADVQRHLSGEPVIAAPPSAGYRLRKFVRKHRGQVSFAMTILILLVVTTLVSTFFYRSARTANTDLTNSIRKEQLSAQEAQWQIYVANLCAAQLAMSAGAWQEARDQLAACPNEKRGWEWEFLKRKADATLMELPPAARAVFSPDGRFILAISEYAQLWDSLTGKRFGKPMPDAEEAAFSPDGSMIITSPLFTGYDGMIMTAGDEKRHPSPQLYDVATGTKLREFPVPESAARFGRDGKFVIIQSRGKDMLWDASTGVQLGQSLPEWHHILDVRQGRVLVENSGIVEVWSLSGTKVGGPLTHKASVRSGEFSDDATLVLTTTTADDVTLWDWATGTQIGATIRSPVARFGPDGRQLLTLPTIEFSEGEKFADISPDGRLFLTTSQNAVTLRGLDGLHLAEIPFPESDKGWMKIAKFSHDGRFLVAGAEWFGRNMPVRVYSGVHSGWSERTLINDDLADLELAAMAGVDSKSAPWDQSAMLPDGKRRVTLQGRKVQFNDPSSGRLLTAIPLDAEATGVRFSADGAQLLFKMSDNIARIWDTRDTDERQSEQLARKTAEAYVEKLFGGSLPNAELEPFVRYDKSISLLTRVFALRLLRIQIGKIDLRVEGVLQALRQNYASFEEMLIAAQRLELPARIQDNILRSIRELGFPDANSGELEQWASSVIEYSSQFSDPTWSAKQAVGIPNTFRYGDINTAWAPKNASGGMQFLTLAFPREVYATGITIRETNCNGFVRQVDVIKADGAIETVWKGLDPSHTGSPVNYYIPFRRTSLLVKAVKIHVDTNHASGYEEIDAVKLHGVAPTSAPASQPSTTRPAATQPPSLIP